MNNEVIQTTAETVAAAATETPKSVKANEFQEVPKIEVTGDFRGYWRDVAVRGEDGKQVVKDGQPVTRRQFKMTRAIKLRGKTVRQAAWLNEADAKAHGLADGVKYNLTLSVEEDLTPDKSNGREGYLDEYAFGDPTIVSVNGK